MGAPHLRFRQRQEAKRKVEEGRRRRAAQEEAARKEAASARRRLLRSRIQLLRYEKREAEVDAKRAQKELGDLISKAEELQAQIDELNASLHGRPEEAEEEDAEPDDDSDDAHAP